MGAVGTGRLSLVGRGGLGMGLRGSRGWVALRRGPFRSGVTGDRRALRGGERKMQWCTGALRLSAGGLKPDGSCGEEVASVGTRIVLRGKKRKAGAVRQ